MEEFFLNLYLAIFYTSTTKGVRFVAIGQYLRALCNNLPFHLYLPFYWWNFPETSYLAPYSQALQLLWLRLQLVNHSGHFNWRTKYMSDISRLPLKGFLWNFKCCTFRDCATAVASLVVTCRHFMELFVGM